MKKIRKGLRYLILGCMVVCLWQGDHLQMFAEEQQVTEISATYQSTKLTSLKQTGANGFTLQWEMMPDAVGYQVYRSTQENGKYSCIHTTTADVNTYTDTGKKGVTYYYYIKTIYLDGESAKSNSLSGYLPISGKAQSKQVPQMNKKFYMGSTGMYMGNYASVERTGYYKSGDKFYVVRVSDNGNLEIYSFDSKLNYKGKKTVKLGQYDLYGGFYAGIDGNFYVAVGYFNNKEQDSKTVIKVMQYDSKWKLKKTAKIKGNAVNGFKGIYKPFEAGSCRMDMSGSTLYIHTARLMYKHDDGLHHQSNITFEIDTKTMKYKSAQDSYSSHSFNQFVKFKDNCLYLANHGDAYPRSIHVSMIKNYGSDNEEKITTDVLELLGATGDNYTGATIGGMEVGSDNVLICGTAQPHKDKIKGVTGFGTYKNKKGLSVSLKHNVYLTVVDRDTGKSKHIWLTKNNPKSSNIMVGNTRMVKLSDNRFAILYQTTNGTKKTLNYVVVDNNGKKIYGKKYSGYVMTGDSQPILYKGYIQWVSVVWQAKTQDYVTTIYRIPATY